MYLVVKKAEKINQEQNFVNFICCLIHV